MNWFRTNFKLYTVIEIVVGTYYLHGNNVNGFTWIASQGLATIESTGIDLVESGTSLGSFELTAQYGINLVLPNLPENGLRDFNFRVYQPYSNIIEYINQQSLYSIPAGQLVRLRNFKLTYLSEEDEPTEELILSTIINEGENLEEITVSHADGSNTSTLNSYRLLDGSITNQWTRRGETDDTNILALFLKQLGILRGNYTRILNAKVIGELEMINTIEQTVGGSINEYYIKSYNWNIALAEYDFTLSEIGNIGVDVTIRTEEAKVPVNLLEDNPTLVSWDDGETPRSPIITPTQITPILTEQRNLNGYI